MGRASGSGRFRLGVCLLTAITGGVTYACSAANAGHDDRVSATSSNTDDDAGAAGSTTDPSGSSGSGGSTAFLGGGPSDASSSPLGEEPCVSTVQQAETIVTEQVVEVPVQVEIQVPVTTEVTKPVALYIMLDQSASMNDKSGSTTKWQAAKDSINAFVNDPASAGIDVAFNEFAGGIAILDFNCSGSQYATPLVAMGPLPDNAPNVTNALNNTSPTGVGTNIEPGLRAATQACTAHQQATGEQCVVVFITDGAPNVCSTDANTLSSIAGDAFTQNSVMTFAVGMGGSDFNLLNQIAQAGGTDCDPNGPNFACDVQQSASALVDALNRIRETVTVTEYVTQYETQYETQIQQQTQTIPVDCEWLIPAPPEGETLDPNKVNVQFSSGTTAATTIGYVSTQADCQNVVGGWYYDDPSAPTKIFVCPQTCDVIQAIPDATISIVLGCETEPAILR